MNQSMFITHTSAPALRTCVHLLACEIAIFTCPVIFTVSEGSVSCALTAL